MSVNISRPPDTSEAFAASSDGLAVSQQPGENVLTLGNLPVGARLILRCRKDWRDATVASISLEATTLSVSSPSGHTYRVRRPLDSLLSLDGSIPVLGKSSGWRVGRVRYDHRW